MHPYQGQSPVPAARGLLAHQQPARHRLEILLLVLVVGSTALMYLGSIGLLATGAVNEYVILVLAAPILIFIGRGVTFAGPRANGVRMTPTQFADGYHLVQQAAQRFGMKQAPEAFVILGNGQINAFASGHGFRRYVVVYSDLFEIGGKARDPEALAFIVGHEVGHIAAGHASYWRQLGMFAMQFVPFLGSALSRSMEYTADNHGFANRPTGAPGAVATLGAGKYLNAFVGYDELADRSYTETGFFVWLTNALASHPVLIWRAHALRDRSKHGRLLWRPRPKLPMSPPLPTPGAQVPVGSQSDWPTMSFQPAPDGNYYHAADPRARPAEPEPVPSATTAWPPPGTDLPYAPPAGAYPAPAARPAQWPGATWPSDTGSSPWAPSAANDTADTHGPSSAADTDPGDIPSAGTPGSGAVDGAAGNSHSTGSEPGSSS